MSHLPVLFFWLAASPILHHRPEPRAKLSRHMLLTLKFIAVLSASVFAGAALYINLVEHPARMTLDAKAAAMEWAPSYARATLMQAPLALASLVGGLGSWLLGAGIGWAVAAILIGAVVPFTLLIIMPTNKALLALGRDFAPAETTVLLMRWARLHAVRTVLGLASASLYVLLTLGFDPRS